MSDPLSVNHSRIPYRGQLISPPAPTSLEYPSKSVAGARYVDLRKSPRSSNEDHRGWEGGRRKSSRSGSTNIPTKRAPPLPRRPTCAKIVVSRGGEDGGGRNRDITLPSVEIHRWQFRAVEETLARIGDTTRLLSAKG